MRAQAVRDTVQDTVRQAWWRRLLLRLLLPFGCVVLGVLATWPRVTYLARGLLPNGRDEALYTWDMWWVAHQAEHLANPFVTHLMFAPTGSGLAYDTLMPLIGLIMMPVTVTAGAAASVNVLSVLAPGLACYAMYRAARLWLPPTGALASGVFFGLSSMITWRAWFQLNLAIGAVFLPVALEAAIRLRREPNTGRAVALGLVIGLCVLTDSESTILTLIMVAVALAGWPRPAASARLLGLVAAVALAVSSPQLIAMAQQAGTAASNPSVLAADYAQYGAGMLQMFTPSPRLGSFGGRLFYEAAPTEGMPTFGVTLTLLALTGAAVGWRGRFGRRTRTWLVLWAAACLMALGPVLYIWQRPVTPLAVRVHGQLMSLLLPYTWFVQLPGLADFREPNRFTILGLVPAALLAGSAVAWIRRRAALVLLPVAVLAALELGWSAVGSAGTMPTGLPAVDQAITADHSSDLVVDVPLGFRSGTLWLGPGFPAEELVEATLDGHPRAIGYVSHLPESIVPELQGQAFYADLLRLQAGSSVPASTIPAAASDARRLDVGWVLVWTQVTPRLAHFLSETGFAFRSRVDGVSVYRARPLR
jgi:hypothetical protein